MREDLNTAPKSPEGDLRVVCETSLVKAQRLQPPSGGWGQKKGDEFKKDSLRDDFKYYH